MLWNPASMLIGRSVYFRTKAFLFKDHLTFFLQEPILAATYLLWGFFQNPYRACRRSKLGIYGETPFKVYREIAQELDPNDHYLELGSGRGKGCFWINRLTKCKVSGIELHPAFYLGAKYIQKIFRKHKVSFFRGDFLKTDLKANFIYIYGTSLSESEVQLLSQRIPIGTTTATVSLSFSEYFPKGWEIKKTLTARFPWGMAKIFIEKKLAP